MKTPTMQVSHFDGDVTIALSPALARDVAAIWAQAHAGDPFLDETRPRWHDDVIALISNAALADQHAGGGPAPVQVPFLAFVATKTSPAHGVGAPSEPPAPPAVSSVDEGDDHGPASAGETRTEVVSR